MSLSTKPKDGIWILQTFDNEEFYLSYDEYTLVKELLAQSEIKFAIFDDGSMALSNIKIIRRNSDYREDLPQLEEPKISEQQLEQNRERIAEIKANYMYKVGKM